MIRTLKNETGSSFKTFRYVILAEGPVASFQNQGTCPRLENIDRL